MTKKRAFNPKKLQKKNLKKGEKKGPKKIHRGNFQVQDKWFDRAKMEGYRARSAYKLLQLDEKFDLIQPGMFVLDVASAPGSWLQVLSRKIGPEWFAIGFDLQKIKSLKKPNVATFVGDIFGHEQVRSLIDTTLERSENWKLKIEHWELKFDLITSDIAPKTTGQKGVDQYESIKLNLAILDLSKELLKPWGTLVMKVFIWEDINDLIRPVKKYFTKLHRYSPPAVRRQSFEEYFICSWFFGGS